MVARTARVGDKPRLNAQLHLATECRHVEMQLFLNRVQIDVIDARVSIGSASAPR